MKHELRLRLEPRARTDFGDAVGRIAFGNLNESFGVSLRFWQPSDYLTQWTAACEDIDAGTSSVVISSMDDPTEREGIVWLWLLYVNDAHVHLQQRLLVLANYPRTFTPDQARSWMEPRARGVSEWTLPRRGLAWRVELVE